MEVVNLNVNYCDLVYHNTASNTDPVKFLQVTVHKIDLPGALSPCCGLKKSIKTGLLKF